MGYVITILFLIALTGSVGFAIGFFVAKEQFYQKGMEDEAARWKSKIEIVKGQKAY